MNLDYESDDEVPILLNVSQQPGKDNGVQNLNEEEDDEAISLAPNEVVPVTILTGFLGSGKTTLINYILKSPNHGKKIAVIENEYSGASAAASSSSSAAAFAALGSRSAAEKEGLNIETMIARDGSDNSNLTDLIELPNGCLCCTVKDSLVDTLETLLDKKKELDYIMIECSGMANPGPIASVFWLDDALESRLRLDGIVACVDARNLDMQLRETTSSIHRKLLIDKDPSMNHTSNGGTTTGGDEAAQQIAFADRIILNKIDLLEGKKDGKIQNVIDQIRAINSTAPIKVTTHSQIDDLNWVLDTKCFDVERAQGVEKSFELVVQEFCLPCAVPPPIVDGHTHTNSISTVAFIEKGSVDLKMMNTWLASILWPDQDKADSMLKSQLEELERLNQITTPEMMEQKRDHELLSQMHIFRIKGILSIKHDEAIDDTEFIDKTSNLDKRKYIVQAVNDLWEINPTDSEKWTSEQDRICKLVVIGRNLNNAQLLAGFRECIK